VAQVQDAMLVLTVYAIYDEGLEKDGAVLGYAGLLVNHTVS